jgi:hypothetical protein
MRLIIITLCLLANSSNLAAVELFGLKLADSSQKELRDAAKKAGVVLIRESDESLWFDSYDSSSVLPGSSRLYLGFVRQDQRFAFAEYEFVGLKHNRILARLSQKYGSGQRSRGRFLSDQEYRWQQDGIQITFKTDWQNYRTRLSYTSPTALKQLKKEKLDAEQKKVEENSAQTSSIF